MSFRSSQHLRQPIAVLAAAVITLLAFAAFAVASDASMKGSYYKAMLKEKKSKKKASSATKAAMKGTSGFYGFKLKGKKAKYIPAKNGTLIWSKVETGKKRHPDSSRTVNVLYSSRNLRDGKIPVSGTVMLPKTKKPRAGWPVISWAHGTTGIADQCAPSRLLGKPGFYTEESNVLIGDWLKAGYAVVATDYEGLGTPGTHPYLIGDSEGRGVLDIAKAARQLDNRISKTGVLAGHSQGGQAILFAAKLANSWGKGLNFRGTVAYAPASNFATQANNIGALTSTSISALALMIARGMTVADSSIKPGDILTEDAMKQYPKTDTLCYDKLADATKEADLKPSNLLKPGWLTSSPSGKKFETQLKLQNPAVEVPRPVLIPQGEDDTTVFPLTTDLLVGELEGLNPQPGRITYQMFPGATHSSILLDSRTEVSLFIKEQINP